MAKVARVCALIMGVAMIVPAVVAELSRSSERNDYVPPLHAVPEPAGTQTGTQANKSPSKVLEVPSLLVGGREFAIFAHPQKTTVQPRSAKQLTARTVPLSQQRNLRRRLVYQQPIMDPRATMAPQAQPTVASPLYVVQEPPERHGWRRLVARMFSGIHDRWVARRSRSIATTE